MPIDEALSELESVPRTAIDTTEIKEKLANLEQYMPEMDKTIYTFAKYLGERLNDHLFPEGMNLQLELVMCDLAKGVDMHGKPTPHSISQLPSPFYSILRMYSESIIDVVAPGYFAREFKQVYKDTHELAKKRSEEYQDNLVQKP
jgi:hypothetical protein